MTFRYFYNTVPNLIINNSKNLFFGYLSHSFSYSLLSFLLPSSMTFLITFSSFPHLNLVIRHLHQYLFCTFLSNSDILPLCYTIHMFQLTSFIFNCLLTTSLSHFSVTPVIISVISLSFSHFLFVSWQ